VPPSFQEIRLMHRDNGFRCHEISRRRTKNARSYVLPSLILRDSEARPTAPFLTTRSENARLRETGSHSGIGRERALKIYDKIGANRRSGQ
jgi:hypothetical protein